MIDTNNLEEARKLIDKLHKQKEKVIARGKSIDFNRKILENKKVNILILSHEEKKDMLKQRDSGLNHILCKIARDNNIILAIDMNELKIENKKEKAKILARIMQNIKLIKKVKNKLIIINKPEDKYNLRSFLLVLGADTSMAKKAAEN